LHKNKKEQAKGATIHKPKRKQNKAQNRKQIQCKTNINKIL
jgi:hypothetical protein